MQKGGSRLGSGRPKGSGKYGESTKAIRVPLSQLEKVREVLQEKPPLFPLYESAVMAGFPSPAENKIERHLDLHELLIKHPVATFFVRVSGSSMIGAGIHDGDILIVDRSLTPVHGKIVVAAVDGEFTVKRLYSKDNLIRLLAENEAYPPIEITEGSELHIWGVVTYVLHAV